MVVEVVAWDVYNTILEDKPLRLRPGVRDCLTYLNPNFFQVTCSDCDTENVKRDLKEFGVLCFFVDFFPMSPYIPKDFSGVSDVFGCSFDQILVIGNNYKIDIELAKQQGCKTLHVPLSKQLCLEDVVSLVG